MSSPEITQIQQRLKEQGFFTYPKATGYFGAITEEAVKAFQRAMNLPATGIVDDATYAKLKKPASNDTLAIGSRGAAVSDLQRRLKQLGYFRYPQITGYYGAVTADAVKQFQQANGLPATGRADRATLERLKQKATSQPATSSDALTIGSRGDQVRELQQQLKQLGYFTYSEVTGYYGVLTADAVRRFQRDNGLPVTGAVDNQTAARLASAVKEKTTPGLHRSSASVRRFVSQSARSVKTSSAFRRSSKSSVTSTQPSPATTAPPPPMPSAVSNKRPNSQRPASLTAKHMSA